jgi:2-polyprenyl-6-methoxyphenol hydroxylase-like FAD-dependent oxidoreductase
MTESATAVFDRLVTAAPPESADALFDTACVLGGSIAGLLAARVLTDHAHRVVVIDRDPVELRSRPGVPQGHQVHALLPGGLGWMERWFPGLTKEMQHGGAVLADPDHAAAYLDGRQQVRTGDHDLLYASRPFMEARLRERVLDLPGVSVLQGQARGLEYRGGTVTGVRYSSGMDGAGVDAGGVLAADFVVDAMGRGSRLADWLAADGYDRPPLQRVPSAVNYATALLRRGRRPEELPVQGSIARWGAPNPVDGVAVAVALAIEDDRWIVMLMGYDDDRPGQTLEAIRAACAKLPEPYPEATSGELTAEIATYHQADSRRRDFAGLERFPSRLISTGDAVASFNPIYGQGMSSAALHASCLSEYLSQHPDLDAPAMGFFDLQKVAVDAAWAISAGSDATRADALSGADVPEEVGRQRWAIDQILRATLTDKEVCRAFENVAYMVAHPSTLADPALLERAVTANRGGGPA